MSSKSLLPSNASSQELALEMSVCRLSDVPIRTRDIWDYEKCPSNLLPWLAWSKSVDDWDEGWTSEQKRAVIAASFSIHKQKGTVGSVKRALSSIGYPSRIIEWFQSGGSGTPFTFNVRVGVNDRGIDSSIIKSIIGRIDSSKNARSHYTLSLVLSSSLGVKVGALPFISPKYICRPYQPSLPVTTVECGSAGMPRIAITYKVSAL